MFNCLFTDVLEEHGGLPDEYRNKVGTYCAVYRGYFVVSVGYRFFVENHNFASGAAISRKKNSMITKVIYMKCRCARHIFFLCQLIKALQSYASEIIAKILVFVHIIILSN